jgi:hypothetical protein
MLSAKDIDDYKSDRWVQPVGVKYDESKPPIALVDAEYIEGLAEVLGFGAKKYDADNWRKGISYRRLISAAYRHLGAINKGEDIDEESGFPHVYHLACCTMFLSSMLAHRPDMDDRWKDPL